MLSIGVLLFSACIAGCIGIDPDPIVGTWKHDLSHNYYGYLIEFNPDGTGTLIEYTDGRATNKNSFTWTKISEGDCVISS